MKKLFILMLVFVSFSLSAQIGSGAATSFNYGTKYPNATKSDTLSAQTRIPILKASDGNLLNIYTTIDSLSNYIPVKAHASTHLFGGTDQVSGEDLSVNVVPPTENYTPLTNTLEGHLYGIDLALGDVQSTTAGVLTRIYFTGDETTTSEGTFYLSNAVNKGTVPTVSQIVSNNDNIKSYFAQDILSPSSLITTNAEKGSYTAHLDVETEDLGGGNNYQQRFTIEIYIANSNGLPIASGVTGAPVGDLGVQVLSILDSGILNLSYGSVNNITLIGDLSEEVPLTAGNRIRYHISAEKIGTSGGIADQTLYIGSDRNSYYDIPTPILWGNISGTLSDQTDLQAALDAKQSTLVSGTNIKTIESQSLLGSGNIDLTKSDVGLSNVDNTSDLNKPISTATQSALDLKANDSEVVHLSGSELITGAKSFDTGDGSPRINVNVSAPGGEGVVSSIGFDGAAIRANAFVAATGFNYVGQNNGTNTFTVDKLGNIIANSFIKTGGTSSQFLKADGSVDSNSYLLSSSYTAADVLSKLLTVDGSGSGLDADLLRGVHWGNVNTNISTTQNISVGTSAVNGRATINKGSGGFPVLGSSSNSVLTLHGTSTGFGLNFTTDGSGKNILQSQRFDGPATVYDLTLQPLGGNVSIGNGTATAAYRLDVNGTGRFTSDLTANSFIKSGGTNQQALLADGTVKTVPKVYTALISQSGTDAPTSTVLDNNLGGTITWARSSPGIYTATLSISGYTADKTIVFTNEGGYSSADSTTINWVRTSSTIITFRTVRGGSALDGLLNVASVRIEVYP